MQEQINVLVHISRLPESPASLRSVDLYWTSQKYETPCRAASNLYNWHSYKRGLNGELV